MSGEIEETTDATFDILLNSTDDLVIVEFYTDTCPNCKAMAPIYAGLAEELSGKAVFTRMNAGQNSGTASAQGVRGVPTFRFFCMARPIGELVGAVNATLLRNTIKDLVRHRTECVGKSTPISYGMDGYG